MRVRSEKIPGSSFYVMFEDTLLIKVYNFAEIKLNGE